jgi:mannose-6-phosphate isomerase-like protein (cupin superfamily)
MTLIMQSSAPEFDADGTTITGYAAPSRGASAVSLWRIEMAPSSSSPLHEMDVEEVFFGLQGEATLVADGTETMVTPGDCLILPARTPFTLTAGTDRPFQAVACMTAGGKATMLPGGPTFVPPWTE